MNYNIAAYLVYLTFITFVIVYVGRLFHGNGRIFILSLFSGDAQLTDKVNNVLLIAYYLFNIGYAFVTLRYWEIVEDGATLISSVSAKMGILVLSLAATHYLNMTTIYILSKHKTLNSHV